MGPADPGTPASGEPWDDPLSRAPVVDPRHVPFTYVTEAVNYTVRDGGLVEIALTSEHVADPEAEDAPARVVEARLAMPVATARSLADVLGRIAGHAPADDVAPPAADPATVSHAVIVAGLDFVVRELLDHSVPPEDREGLLDLLRDRLRRELGRANIGGPADAPEGSAIEHALGVIDQMFARWQGAAADEAS
jgi:hypothetical protein